MRDRLKAKEGLLAQGAYKAFLNDLSLFSYPPMKTTPVYKGDGSTASTWREHGLCVSF